MRVHAIVEGQDRPVFVTDLSENEFDKLGDDGIEELVKQWCKKRNFIYIDFAT